jgi:hypothetical protein
MFVLPSAEVRAEMTHWSYESIGAPNPVMPSNSAGGPVGHITLTGITPMQPELGSATVRVLNLTATGTHMVFTNSQFAIGMRISDTASHQVGNMFFTAAFNGTLDAPTQSSSVTVTFLNPSTQSLVLGQTKYTVTIGPYHPLQFAITGPADGKTGTFSGSIDAQVSVSPNNPSNTPEPSGLALAGMGLITVAGAAWRKRQAVK